MAGLSTVNHLDNLDPALACHFFNFFNANGHVFPCHSYGLNGRPLMLVDAGESINISNLLWRKQGCAESNQHIGGHDNGICEQIATFGQGSCGEPNEHGNKPSKEDQRE